MTEYDDGDTLMILEPVLCIRGKLIGLVVNLHDYENDTMSSCGLDRGEVKQLRRELKHLLK